MRAAKQVEAWVVYKMTLHGTATQQSAVCEQSEWDVMEHCRPGYHTLVRAGITNEIEAELLARGALGDAKARQPRRS